MITKAYTDVDKKGQRSKPRAGASINMEELKELQGKSEYQMVRDTAVRKLMEYTRDSCRVEWAGMSFDFSKASHVTQFAIGHV
jgi:hypothetical protein